MLMGTRIRQARRKVGITQAELAARLTVQRSAVSNWESGHGSCPATSNLVAIALACNVSLEWLATGRGSMTFVSDAAAEIPAVDADLIELPDERELILRFREMPERARQLLLELTRELGLPKRKRRTHKVK